MDLLNMGLKSIDVHSAILGKGRPLLQSNLLHGSRSRARLNEEGQKSEKSSDRKTHSEERSERGEGYYEMKQTSAAGLTGCRSRALYTQSVSWPSCGSASIMTYTAFQSR